MNGNKPKVATAPLAVLAFAAVLGAPLAGCGSGGPRADYSLVELVKGHGTITLDGAPLAHAVVTFEDPRDDTMSYGMTDTSGVYTLQFDSEMAGVKVGPKTVRISTARKLLGLTSPAGEENPDGDPDEVKPEATERVPARYNEQSELSVDVIQGSSRYDFALVSD